MEHEFQNDRKMNLRSEITFIALVYHYYLSHHQLWSSINWLLRQHLC